MSGGVAGMKGSARSFRIGLQADRDTTAASMIDIPIPSDGSELAATLETEDLDTLHGSDGVLHTAINARNNEAQGFSPYLFPEIAGTIMDGVFAEDANGCPNFYSVEEHWKEALGAGEDEGQRFKGVVFDALTLDLNKAGSGAPIRAQTSAYLRQKQAIADGESVHVPDFGPVLPYNTRQALVDFLIDNSGAFGGATAGLRNVNIQIQRQGELDDFGDDPDEPTIDGAWGTYVPGTLQVQIAITARVLSSALLKITDTAEPVKAGLRVVLPHPKAPKTATTGASVLSGSTDNATQDITVADSSDFAVGDIVVLTNSQGFAFAEVSVIPDGTTLTLNTDEGNDGKRLRVSMDHATDPITVRGWAIGLEIDALNFQSQGPIQREGAFSTVALNYTASLAAGQTKILDYLAQNVVHA